MGFMGGELGTGSPTTGFALLRNLVAQDSTAHVCQNGPCHPPTVV